MGGSKGEDKWSRPPPHKDLFALEVVILGHRAWADPEGCTSGPDPLPHIDSDRLVCARSCDLRSSCMGGSIGEDRGSRPPPPY